MNLKRIFPTHLIPALSYLSRDVFACPFFLESRPLSKPRLFFLPRTFRKFPAKTKITKNNHLIWSCSVFVASPDGSSATPTFSLPRPPGSFGPSTCPVFSSVLSDKCELPVQSLIFCVLWMLAIFSESREEAYFALCPNFSIFCPFFCFNNALVLSSFTFFSFLETPKTKQEKILSSVVCVAACVMCSALLCLGVDNQIHSTSVYLKPFRVESQRTNFFKTKLNREQLGLTVQFFIYEDLFHPIISFHSHHMNISSDPGGGKWSGSGSPNPWWAGGTPE